MEFLSSLVFYRVCIDTDEYFFMDVLLLIWSILGDKFISEILVENGFNHGMVI